MGCAQSGGKVDEKAFDRNRLLDRNLRSNSDRTVKLLLLGTGDSGKSTFAKQMRMIHKNGFSHTDRKFYRGVLRENVLNAAQMICWYAEGVEHQFSPEVTEVLETINECSDLMEQGCAEAIATFWGDKSVQRFVKKNINEIQIPSSYKYYFDNLDRFVDPNYSPLNDDILLAKLKTTGVNETEFEQDAVLFKMVDVGGQRSERRKWLHCFDGVTAAIYLTSLNEYNLVLQEDGKTNRLDESLTLFQELTSSQWLQDKSVILFLNKSDIFEEKIKTEHLSEYFDDVAPDANFDQCVEYIKAKYKNVYPGKGKMYAYITCALDTENCRKVFAAVKDTIIMKALLETNQLNDGV